MLDSNIIIFLIFIAITAANLPWVSQRLFAIYPLPNGNKAIWLAFFEWFILYIIIGLVAFGFEKKYTSEIYDQNWEFYVSTLCLFLVFALPGFLYRIDLKRLLERAK
ncbi:MAG: DUF2818 family protein [Woeseiaceae bacterium]